LIGAGMIRPQPPSCSCNRGWICDAHPDLPFLHSTCDGSGIACRNHACPYWQGPRPLAHEPGVQFSYLYLMRQMRTLDRHQGFKPLRPIERADAEDASAVRDD
jgi:hypothetical protein